MGCPMNIELGLSDKQAERFCSEGCSVDCEKLLYEDLLNKKIRTNTPGVKDFMKMMSEKIKMDEKMQKKAEEYKEKFNSDIEIEYFELIAKHDLEAAVNIDVEDFAFMTRAKDLEHVYNLYEMDYEGDLIDSGDVHSFFEFIFQLSGDAGMIYMLKKGDR